MMTESQVLLFAQPVYNLHISVRRDVACQYLPRGCSLTSFDQTAANYPIFLDDVLQRNIFLTGDGQQCRIDLLRAYAWQIMSPTARNDARLVCDYGVQCSYRDNHCAPSAAYVSVCKAKSTTLRSLNISSFSRWNWVSVGHMQRLFATQEARRADFCQGRSCQITKSCSGMN